MNKSVMISKLKRTCGLMIITVAVCVGIFINFAPSAYALPYNNITFVATTDTNPLDTVFGSGTSEKIEGKAQEDIGTAKKKASELKGATKEKVTGLQGQAEGTVDQVQGKAKKNIGEIQQRTDEASSDLEKASDNLIDSVKHLFD